MGAKAGKQLSRRGFLKWTGRAAAAVAVGGCLDAICIEPGWLNVTHPVVTVGGLPGAWDGVRLAVWADVHSGWLITLDYLREAVGRTNAESPDILLMPGDLINHDEPKNCVLADILGGLEAAECKFGCHGNHDHRTAMAETLEAAGIVTLQNAHRILYRDGRALCIGGVDDLQAGRPDIHAALSGVGPGVPRVVMCHIPDYAHDMPFPPRVDLMVCGHTHGGQVRVPFVGPLSTGLRHRQYTRGLNAGPHCPVYTTTGLGMGVVPARLDCRPEVAIITLRRA